MKSPGDNLQRTVLQDTEARQAAILNTALDCIVTMDHQGRIVEFNPAAERTFGYRRGEVIGKPMAELIIPPSLRAMHYQGVQHYLKTGEGPVLGRRIEITAMRSDGTEFPVELAITRIPTQGPPLFTGFVRDITDRWNAERRRNARLAVTQILAHAHSLSAVSKALLQTVCESLGWDFGAVWELRKSADQLTCIDVWSGSEPMSRQFGSDTQRRTFPIGIGLPGRVWQSGQAAWIPDVVTDSNFPRSGAALQAGLHGAFAVPIAVGTSFYGVIEFFSGNIREPDADLLEMMNTIGGQVALFLERRRAEEDLRDSEQRFAGFMHNLPGLAWIKNLQGRYVYANDTALKVFGRSETELYGSDDESMFPPETAAQFRENDQKAITTRTGIQAIERLRHEDGVVHQSIVSKFPILNSQGRPILVGGVAIDITDRLRAEQVVREREEQLRLLTDALPALISYIDRDGIYRIVNKQHEVWFGRSREEVEGRHLREVLGERAFDSIREHMAATLAGEEVTFEGLVPYADGGNRHVRATYVPHRNQLGVVEGFFALITDVTQQKRTESAYRFLAEASSTLAALVDHESTLRKVAGLAVPFFADWCVIDLVEPDGMLRRLDVVHADPSKGELADRLRQHPARLDDPFGPAAVARTGRPEISSHMGDGIIEVAGDHPAHGATLRALRLRSYICVPLQARGRILGVITFIAAESDRVYGPRDLELAQDLAHRAAVAIDNAVLYGKLREADRLKDEFLAMLAHELRNPLAPIRNALHVIKLQASRPSANPVLEMAERQVQHMARLLDDLLDVSRISRGTIELRKQYVDVASLINRTVESVHSVIENRQHRLTIALPPEPLRIEGDPTRLEQILTNLLTNAAKYTDPGGSIWIHVERDTDQVVIRVRDSGIGIAPEMLSKIFDLFVQAERRLDRSQGGVGIGLTLVRRLVEMHGGTIEAQSRGPGLGSEFILRLPARPALQATAIPSGARNPMVDSLTKRRVLVVDDNQDAADTLALLLQIAGQEVRTAYNGTQAIDEAQSHPPDIVFLDIGMPGMDGYEVAAQLRQKPEMAGTVLVALTGWGQDEDRRRTREAGFNHHMVKPVEPEALHKLLAEYTPSR